MLRVTVDAAGDLVTELHRLTRDLESISARVAEAVAPVAVDAMTAAVVGRRGSMTLSNWDGGRGVTLTLDPFTQTGAERSQVTIVAQPMELWRGVDQGFRAGGEIRPRTRKAMTTPHGLYGKVNHVGTRPTGVWDTAKSAAESAIGPAADAIVRSIR